jgi:hypothetical protein
MKNFNMVLDIVDHELKTNRMIKNAAVPEEAKVLAATSLFGGADGARRALIGAGLGGAAGLAGNAIANTFRTPEEKENAEMGPGRSALFGALAGGGLGLTTGKNLPPEATKWLDAVGGSTYANDAKTLLNAAYGAGRGFTGNAAATGAGTGAGAALVAHLLVSLLTGKGRDASSALTSAAGGALVGGGLGAATAGGGSAYLLGKYLR